MYHRSLFFTSETFDLSYSHKRIFGKNFYALREAAESEVCCKKEMTIMRLRSICRTLGPREAHPERELI